MKVEFWNTISSLKKLYADVLEPVCQKYQITRMELDILLFLANHPQYDTARDMVEQRKLTKSHVSSSVARLCGRGYLGREYRDGNNKNVHLMILEPAVLPVTEGQQAQKMFFLQLFDGLSEEEIFTFSNILGRISENIKRAAELEDE